MTAEVLQMPDVSERRERQMLVHVEAGEMVSAGDDSLPEIADKVSALLDRRETDAWEIGRLLSAARLRCERKDCGIEGPNPDARYGRWCTENFGTHGQDADTLLNHRRLWEVFGGQRAEVEHIPRSGLYMLAEPKASDVREVILDDLQRQRDGGEKVKVRDIKQALKQHRSETKQQASGIDKTDDGCTVDDLIALADSGAKFGCIMADPPWVYGNQGTRASTGNHYNGLSVDELVALPVERLAADNAHLHLWTTNAFLFDCQRIMEAWGFTYKSVYIWVKPQMGMGNYWRVSHEFMLFGIRGKCPFNSRSEMSWGEFERTIHSAKPEQIRHKIERVSNGPFLEMFGRRQVAGWTVWGNQISRDLLSLEAVNA